MRSLALLLTATLAISGLFAVQVVIGQTVPCIQPGTPPGCDDGTGGGNNTTAPAPLPIKLYLSSSQGTVGGVGAAETLIATAPGKATDSLRNLTPAGPPPGGSGNAAWYALSGSLPGISGDATVGSAVAGTTYFVVTPVCDPVALGVCLPTAQTVQNMVTFEVRKVSSAGNQTSIGTTTQSFQTSFDATNPTATAITVPWTITADNATLLYTDALALNISATVTGPGQLAVAYDSTDHPSNMSLNLTQLARGSIQLTASPSSKDAAIGGAGASYQLTVRNLGPQQDTVRFAVSGNPSDWIVNLTSANVTVNAGQSAFNSIIVRTAPGATAGTKHTATVTATSGLGGAPATVTLTTTARASTIGGSPTPTPTTRPTPGGCPTDQVLLSDGTCGTQTNPTDEPNPIGGNGGGSGSSLLAPISNPVASALGVNSQTADLISMGLILLFLLIILLLLWFLLLGGGYPVKVGFIEAGASTEPGRSVDYSVEIKSKLSRAQTVDLEVTGLPTDWEVRFSQPRLNLQAKAIETAGLLIRPPDNWPTPSKREFQVRARSRLKPGKFAKAVAKLRIESGAVAEEAPAEQGVAEPAYEPAPSFEPATSAPLPPAPRGGMAFRVGIGEVRHNPEAPERGGEVTTTAKITNNGDQPERIRVVLVVNGKIRDDVRVELGPGEGAEAEFHWVAYLARNEVKVVAERV